MVGQMENALFDEIGVEVLVFQAFQRKPLEAVGVLALLEGEELAPVKKADLGGS